MQDAEKADKEGRLLGRTLGKANVKYSIEVDLINNNHMICSTRYCVFVFTKDPLKLISVPHGS